MKTSLKTVLFVFALLFTSMQIFAQDTYNLNYKFEKGKTYLYRATSSTDMVQNAMGQEVTAKIDSKSKLRFDIANSTPTQIEIISSLDSVYTVQSNSATGEDKISKGENIVGKKTKLIYNQFGKKLQKIVVDAVADDANNMGGGNASILFQLSEKPVKAGDVWNVASVDTNKQGEDGKMIIKSDTEYKLEGKESFNGVECLKISLKAAMKLEGNMTQGGMNLLMEGTGKTTGAYYFDYAKGIILSIDSSTNIDLTVALPDQNMTIPVTQVIKAKVVLTDK
jgi:hypothetical protein